MFSTSDLSQNRPVDVVILGAGAAGLMCAIEAGKRERSVLVIEASEAIGKKIRISGGGRCNFTNINVSSDHFISNNPHFCKSALARYTPADFIALVDRHGITFHDKSDGQLFCDGSAQQIIDILKHECDAAGVRILLNRRVREISKADEFSIVTDRERITSRSLVIATGGLSIPKIGATDFGYRVARQFGIPIVEPKPALVPLIVSGDLLRECNELSGVSLRCGVRCGSREFTDDLLFTHRGFSGPAILQISSYWNRDEQIEIDLLPKANLNNEFKSFSMNASFATNLSRHLPKRLAQLWCERFVPEKHLSRYSKKEIELIDLALHRWKIVPSGTEGFEKAEVTVGGVSTDALSSKTMEAKNVPGLYFIGEVVDVTGQLGGYNFQWAWASGTVAGQSIPAE